MFQTLLLTKTVVHVYKGAQPLFHALFGVKTLSGTLWGPVFNASGLRDEVLGFYCSKAKPPAWLYAPMKPGKGCAYNLKKLLRAMGP